MGKKTPVENLHICKYKNPDIECKNTTWIYCCSECKYFKKCDIRCADGFPIHNKECCEESE